MVECILFDKSYNQIDLIKFSEAKFIKHIYDPEKFTIKTYEKIDTGCFVTFIENHKPLFSGIITESKLEKDIYEYSGYELRYLLVYAQYALIYGVSPVEWIDLNLTNTTLIVNLLMQFFSTTTFTIEDNVTPVTYRTSIRVKSLYQIIRECIINTDIFYNIYLIGTRTIKLIIDPIRDMRRTIVLIDKITHNEISRVIDIKEKYNQLLALGAGEDTARDYYLIDNLQPGEIPKCYVHDLREDIVHDELIKRAENKYKELQFDYDIEFELLNNNVAKFLVDFNIGDYISFKTYDGLIFEDLVSEYEVSVKAGYFNTPYKLHTGLIKNTLTDKIKELKEGGFK